MVIVTAGRQPHPPTPGPNLTALSPRSGFLDVISCNCWREERGNGPFKQTYKGMSHYVQLDDDDDDDYNLGRSHRHGHRHSALGKKMGGYFGSGGGGGGGGGGDRGWDRDVESAPPPELDLQYSLRLRTSQLSIFCLGNHTLISVQKKSRTGPL